MAINPEALKPTIQAHITFLEDQVTTLRKQLRTHVQTHESLQAQADLLESIVGIGIDTAARLLTERRYQGLWLRPPARGLWGLTPREHTSGTSVNGKTRLCKISNARLRKALFFPSMVFLRRTLELQPWRERLAAAGKTKMAIIGAAMHKLIRIVYGVLTSGQSFDSTKLSPPKSAAATP